MFSWSRVNWGFLPALFTLLYGNPIFDGNDNQQILETLIRCILDSKRFNGGLLKNHIDLFFKESQWPIGHCFFIHFIFYLSYFFSFFFFFFVFFLFFFFVFSFTFSFADNEFWQGFLFVGTVLIVFPPMLFPTSEWFSSNFEYFFHNCKLEFISNILISRTWILGNSISCKEQFRKEGVN